MDTTSSDTRSRSRPGKQSGGSARADEDRALRDKFMFWNERPAIRFCLYFGIFVFAEVLVGITLHYIFHII